MAERQNLAEVQKSYEAIAGISAEKGNGYGEKGPVFNTEFIYSFKTEYERQMHLVSLKGSYLDSAIAWLSDKDGGADVQDAMKMKELLVAKKQELSSIQKITRKELEEMKFVINALIPKEEQPEAEAPNTPPPVSKPTSVITVTTPNTISTPASHITTVFATPSASQPKKNPNSFNEKSLITFKDRINTAIAELAKSSDDNEKELGKMLKKAYVSKLSRKDVGALQAFMMDKWDDMKISKSDKPDELFGENTMKEIEDLVLPETTPTPSPIVKSAEAPKITPDKASDSNQEGVKKFKEKFGKVSMKVEGIEHTPINGLSIKGERVFIPFPHKWRGKDDFALGISIDTFENSSNDKWNDIEVNGKTYDVTFKKTGKEYSLVFEEVKDETDPDNFSDAKKVLKSVNKIKGFGNIKTLSELGFTINEDGLLPPEGLDWTNEDDDNMQVKLEDGYKVEKGEIKYIKEVTQKGLDVWKEKVGNGIKWIGAYLDNMNEIDDTRVYGFINLSINNTSGVYTIVDNVIYKFESNKYIIATDVEIKDNKIELKK